MISLRNSLFAGAALAAFGLVGAANASTITTSVTFGPAVTDYNGTGLGAGTIAAFDSSQGTLTSITFTSSYGFTSSITVTNNAQSGSGGNVDTESAAKFAGGTSAITNILNSEVNTNAEGTAFIGQGSLSPVAYDVTGTKSQYTLASGGTQTVSSTGTTQTNPTVTDTNGTDLAAFSINGGGSIAIDFDTLTGTNLQNSGGNSGSSQSTTATGSLTVTYNFTPPAPVGVPEPASFAILGVGLAGLGLVRRRRI